ncbi:MAG: tRNA lysidine(34) synthetase TilS [Defluviitaleaceae bacterium]|nr:tRNA lysidine(34) synthetase TilS [Defluviitaleaceae bacterium]
MLEIVRQTIKQYNMFAPGDGVVVGLSGGVDSVVLLAVLRVLSKELQLSIYAAHINHNLRSTAIHDEGFARHLCDEWGIPFFVYDADVKGLATQDKLSTEEAGRKLRYKYLRQSQERTGATKIATGHHADDNAETMLLNLFRGAGLKGLCGIPPVNGCITRPLLEVSRSDIQAYAHEHNLGFITDETNASSDYSRNYIRNKIIPSMQLHFGDSVTATMAKNALAMKADEDYLHTAAANAFKLLSHDTHHISDDGVLSYVQAVSSPVISLPIKELLAYPMALVGRIIRQAIAKLRGEQALRDIQLTHIQSILDIAKGQTGREAHLPGFTAKREYKNLILQKNTLHINGYCHTLSPGIPINIQLAEVTLHLKKPSINKPGCTQAFNYGKVEGVLELRTRRAGDKITLAGTGTKKLQDYFTDTKTPKSQRDQIPLLADGSNILWVMDKHNRTNSAYKPDDNQNTCWVTLSFDTNKNAL